ncbi:MAG TPA: 30S ribosomal protein S8e [Thermoplasmata archaeon]|nr:30S ribosomal protein S8e [Thermoplasmata archaeon]
MALWQGRSKRKHSGGRYRPARKKRKFEIASEHRVCVIGPSRKKRLRTRGGKFKFKLLGEEYINVVEKGSTKPVRRKIVSVIENPANPHYVRRNILTKGAIVQLDDKRKARITSRPGQDGVINGVIIEE